MEGFMIIGKKTETIEEAGCYTISASSKEREAKRILCINCIHRNNCLLKK